MSPFEVRAQLKVREEKLDGFTLGAAEIMRQTKEKDTGTLAYDWYISSDGTQCEVREAYVDEDALVQHAMNVREAGEALFAEFAYDHKLAVYGEPSPRLLDLVNKFGVDVTWFAPLAVPQSASVQ